MSRVDVLDDFHDPSSRTPVTSALAELRLVPARRPVGDALGLEFDFKGGGGFVVARKVFDRPMRESRPLRFAVSGAAPANRLELKLADPSGRNVRWRDWNAFRVPPDWETLVVRSSEVEFVWGMAVRGR